MVIKLPPTPQPLIVQTTEGPYVIKISPERRSIRTVPFYIVASRYTPPRSKGKVDNNPFKLTEGMKLTEAKTALEEGFKITAQKDPRWPALLEGLRQIDGISIKK